MATASVIAWETTEEYPQDNPNWQEFTIGKPVLVSARDAYSVSEHPKRHLDELGNSAASLVGETMTVYDVMIPGVVENLYELHNEGIENDTLLIVVRRVADSVHLVNVWVETR